MKTFNLSQFFYYDELRHEAKEQARINIMASILEAHKSQVVMAAAVWKENPHKAINDSMHIKRLINGSEALRKVKKEGEEYLIRYIRSNRVAFTDKGEYVYYITRNCEIISEGERFKIDNDGEKQLAIQAYINVNERGIAYHDWLYRMHHRIKHYMIVNNK